MSLPLIVPQPGLPKLCRLCGSPRVEVSNCSFCGAGDPGTDDRTRWYVVVDFEYGVDQRLTFIGFKSHRLAWLEDEHALREQLRAVLDEYSLEETVAIRDEVVRAVAHAVLHDIALPTAHRDAELVARRLCIATRVTSADPEFEIPDLSDWEVVQFDEGIKEGPVNLQSDFEGTEFLRRGPARPQFGMTASSPFIVESVVLYLDDAPLVNLETRVRAAAEAEVQVEMPWLPPHLVDDLNGRKLEVAVSFAGHEDLYSFDLAEDVEPLRRSHSVVGELSLDVGSTTTKYMMSAGGTRRPARYGPTGDVLEGLGLPPFNKKAFIDHPAAYESWLAHAIPVLSVWAYRTQGMLLRRCAITFPCPAVVESLKRSEAITEVAEVYLGSSERLVLLPEHEAVARRYQPVITELVERIGALEADSREAIREWSQRREAWDRRTNKREALGGLLKFFFDDPGDRPDEPKPPPALAVLQEYLGGIRPDDANNYVVLDAGGFSLDASFVVDGGIHVSAGCTFPGAGGEAVSEKLGLFESGMSSADATLHKQHLGENSDDRTTPMVEYRRATERIYDQRVMDKVATQCRHVFGKRAFFIVLTGGASRNRFFKDLVDECAASFGNVPVVNVKFFDKVAGDPRVKGLTMLQRYKHDVEGEDEHMRGRLDVVAGAHLEQGPGRQ